MEAARAAWAVGEDQNITEVRLSPETVGPIWGSAQRGPSRVFLGAGQADNVSFCS